MEFILFIKNSPKKYDKIGLRFRPSAEHLKAKIIKFHKINQFDKIKVGSKRFL